MLPCARGIGFLILIIGCGAQYQQQQYGGARSGSFQQGGNFQQNGGGYQSSGGQSRYQQSHVVVGPGPVVPNNFGGQFKEQRVINIQENIQGTSQQNAGYGYGSSSFQSSGGYQNGQFGRYGQTGYGQQSGNAGGSVLANTPLLLDASTASLQGAQVDLRLTSYTNSALRLPNSTTCNCPISNCNFIPSNQQNQCQFSFVIVISCADQSIQYIQSNFYPVPANGVMTTGNWTNQYTFIMNTKPIAIDVFVQHLGVVIDSTTGQLLFFNHLSLVDSFVVDLSKFDGSAQVQGSQTLTLSGNIQQTQLQMALNVQCINNMMGPYCDLTCNNTNAQANQAVICYSNRTNTFSACKWNAYRTQVVNCYVCTHGTYNGTCAAAIVVNNWGVASAFRVWTIVLGVLLGIALLLLLCLILAYIICFNRRVVETETASYENNNYRIKSDKSDAGSDQPLVTSEEWSSTSATRKPVGILSKKTETGSEYGGRRQQDSPDTEESYTANGQVQQTTTTTTTTTRREHIV